ncbi:MAG: hypothetical protein Q7R80_01300, partial [bacterium]|nr:hypothetical protein [bacterium]
DTPKKDKVAELRGRLEEASATVRTREQELADAKTEVQTAKAQERLDRAKAKVTELQMKLRKEEQRARYREAEARFKEARTALDDAQLEGFGSPDLGDEFEGVLIDLVEELVNIRRTSNILGRRSRELTDRVRTFVNRHPTGWVAGKVDPAQKYLCWLSRDGRLQVVLEDNPLYGLTVEQLVTLVGFEAAMKFLRVDYTATHDAAKDGLLIRRGGEQNGQSVTVDELMELRERYERTKSVEVVERRGERVEEIVDVIAPELVEEFVEKLEALGLDGNIVNALKASGITRVGQVRCLSGDDLAKIKGIGPARAAEIIRSVVKRAA